MLFFGLSGYLVGTSSIRSIRNGKWSWPNYLTNRLTRLYVALIPALLLTLVFDTADRAVRLHKFALFAGPDKWKDFAGCFIFLQNAYVRPFGSDGPLWSLSCEFWYYILFPLVTLAIFRARHRWLNLILAIAIAVFVRSAILGLFPCWLLGVALGLLKDRLPDLSRRSGLLMGLAGVVLVCGAIVAQGLHVMPINYYYSDSIATIPLLWAGMKAPKATWQPYMALAVFFSEMSYTVYLAHLPFLDFLQTVWLRDRLWPATATHILLLAIPFTAALLYSYVLYRLFESHTDEVRRYVKAKLVPSEKRSAHA